MGVTAEAGAGNWTYGWDEAWNMAETLRVARWRRVATMQERGVWDEHALQCAALDAGSMCDPVRNLGRSTAGSPVMRSRQREAAPPCP